MGLFDSLKNMFAHHEHHHGASIGQPLTLADANAVLAFIVVHQQLADMRKVADAVKQLQDEMPQYITFGMSHYYSEPKRVRFQSEGGKFIDADAIDDGRAQLTEHICQRGFAAGDAAGEGDDLHGGKTSFGEKGMGETNFSIRGERCANGLPRGKLPRARRRKLFVAMHRGGPKGCRRRAESPLQAAV